MNPDETVYQEKPKERVLSNLSLYGPVYFMPPTPVYAWMSR